MRRSVYGPVRQRWRALQPRGRLFRMDDSRSPLVETADELFNRLSPYPGMGFRNHCFRLFEFTRQLLVASNIQFDWDTAYAVAMVHDLGLVHDAPGDNYLQRSLSIFEEAFQHVEVPEQLQAVSECLTLNHRLLPVPNASPAAEAFRQAVWIEHSRGLKRYGLAKAAVEEVFELYARDNLDAVLLDFFSRTLRKEPKTIINGIFF